MNKAAMFIVSITIGVSSNLLLAAPLYDMRAKQVAPDIYGIITPSRNIPDTDNRGWNSNSAFIVTDKGVLLFDTGSSAAIGESLKQAIAQVTKQPVRWIVNSHAHGDHWLGNAAFTTTVTDIYATSEVTTQIQTEGKTWVDNFNKMTDGATGQSDIVPPNRGINQRTELNLGGKRIVLFPSGNSHSPGDLLLWMPDAGVLMSGDVVYSDRMPSTNASNLQQWIGLLAELEQLNPVVVIPGHGEVTDKAGVVRLRSLFVALWDSVNQQFQAGKADFEMVPAVTQALSVFQTHYPGMDQKLKRDLPHVYLQVEAANF